MHTAPECRSRDAGFTLIELLLVVVIIGIIAALVLVRLQDAKEKAYVAAMMNDVRNFALAQEQYFSANAEYVSDDDLRTAGLFNLSEDVETDSIDYSRPDGFFYRVRHTKTDIMCLIDYGRSEGGMRENRVVCEPRGSDSGGEDPEEPGEEPGDGNQAPVASYSVTAVNNAGMGGDAAGLGEGLSASLNLWRTARFSSSLPITADGSASFDPDGEIVAWEWSTAGSVIGTDRILVRTFAAGSVLLTLTVTDDKGATNSITNAIEVVDLSPPVPVIDANPNPPSASTDDVVNLDGGESYDDDGWIEHWYWEFAGQSYVGFNAWLAAPDPGAYVARLTVIDNDGLMASTSVLYEVAPGTGTNPVARLQCPSPIYSGQDLTCTSAASSAPGGINRREWFVHNEGLDFYWSDNGTEAIAIPAAELPGPGLYAIELYIDDHSWQSANAYAVVEVLSGVAPCASDCGEPPVAVLDPASATVAQGESVLFSGLNSSDPDGEIVRYEIRVNGVDREASTWLETFPDVGTFQALLTVYDDKGNRASDASSITVYSGSPPPSNCEMGEACSPASPPIVVCPAGVTPPDLQPTMTPAVPVATSPVVRFTAGTNGAVGVTSYRWQLGSLSPHFFGAIQSGNPADISIPFAAAGPLSIALYMTDTNGCEHAAQFRMDFEAREAPPLGLDVSLAHYLTMNGIKVGQSPPAWNMEHHPDQLECVEPSAFNWGWACAYGYEYSFSVPGASGTPMNYYLLANTTPSMSTEDIMADAWWAPLGLGGVWVEETSFSGDLFATTACEVWETTTNQFTLVIEDPFTGQVARQDIALPEPEGGCNGATEYFWDPISVEMYMD